MRVGGARCQPYRLQDLQTAQQRLAQSGFAESVFVYVDPDSPPQAAPSAQVRKPAVAACCWVWVPAPTTATA